MNTWKFYSSHLERVSRSFSFCIAQLRCPQRDWIALSYLLFRIADTIEDSKWEDQAQQFSQFKIFKQALLSKNNISSINTWLNLFPKEISHGEQLLLNDTERLLQELFKLPERITEQIQKNVCQMMSGMKHFLRHHSSEGELVLSNLSQLNQYCFFVAGLVGELLTVFFVDALKEVEISNNLLFQSFHFGLFLQKINILKDQMDDEGIGRKFVSSRKELRLSITNHAIQALAYIQHLPIKAARSFRLFCAWSLFIGLASLKWIDKSYQEKATYKIPKSETLALTFKIKCIIDSNASLDKLFLKYVPAAAMPQSTISHTNALPLPEWFRTIYPSQFLNTHANELGLLEEISN